MRIWKKKTACLFLIRRTSCGIVCSLLLSGCAGQNDGVKEQKVFVEEEVEEQEILSKEEIEAQGTTGQKMPEKDPESAEQRRPEPETIEADWSEYFDGLQGAAVVYDVSAHQFTIYNRELAKTRRSPCSTFKIISSLAALENGIVVPADSMREWSGEVFWNDEWNKDIDFESAFRASCVWYFREVIDEIGQEQMQKELERLAYGNCDISEWEGRWNTNNNNRALTGFWIESSMVISPKEQTEVMERIFGENSVYLEQTRKELKKVMLVEEQKEAGLCLYGKTGMGKAEGVVVDAWFAGFAESTEKSVYFCVYLGKTEDRNVTSTAAKEIAIRLVSDYYETASCSQ